MAGIFRVAGRLNSQLWLGQCAVSLTEKDFHAEMFIPHEWRISHPMQVKGWEKENALFPSSRRVPEQVPPTHHCSGAHVRKDFW